MKQTITILLFLSLLIGVGCSNEKPDPPEVNLAEVQEAKLWRAGAPIYLPEPYAQYKANLIRAQRNLAKHRSRFPWFRDDEAIRSEFAQLLQQGEELFLRLQAEKEQKRKSILNRVEDLKERLVSLSQLTSRLHEGGPSRSNLTKAGIALNEAIVLYGEDQLLSSEKKLSEGEAYLAEAQKKITLIVNRYGDINLISQWKQWARETIQESRGKESHCILIIKSEKKLVLYQKGEPVKSYPVGLGKNGWLKKRQARDHATPEGKYRIIGKNPRSRYYKALLINYPNENDRKEFLDAKKKGLIVKNSTIGGQIEIHGGGKEGLTYGCIALDNNHMEDLYHRVGIGTPVTIVGALEEHNSLSSPRMEKKRIDE